MIIETLDSFKSNINRRLTNPFLGTFTIVYILRNWEVFYALFNFESSYTLLTKINFIKEYYLTHNGIWELIICVLISFLVLISTYILLSISKYIANVYNMIVIPWITKITDKSKIVLKEDYLFLLSDKEAVEKKYEVEREERIKVQSERDKLENDIVNLKADLNDSKEIKELKSQLDIYQNNLKSKDDEIRKLELVLVNLQEENENIKNNFNNKFGQFKVEKLKIENIIYNEIKKSDLLSEFDNITRFVNNGELIFKQRIQDFFTENNIIKFDAPEGRSMGKISFTDLGNKIYEIRLSEKFTE